MFQDILSPKAYASAFAGPVMLNQGGFGWFQEGEWFAVSPQHPVQVARGRKR